MVGAFFPANCHAVDLAAARAALIAANARVEFLSADFHAASWPSL
jgi:hypothetical protein